MSDTLVSLTSPARIITRTVLYVSVNRTVGPRRPDVTLAEVAEAARGHWPCTPTHAIGADVVVAVLFGKPIAAWRLLGAYAAIDEDETYGPYRRRRTTLDLGEPVPVLPEYASHAPSLRSGCTRVAVGFALAAAPQQ